MKSGFVLWPLLVLPLLLRRTGLRRVRSRLRSTNIKLLAFFLVSAAVSSLFSIDIELSFGYLAMTIAMLTVAIMFGSVNEQTLTRGLVLFGRVGAVYLAGLFLYFGTGGGRFSGNSNPNAMGLMLVGCLATNLIGWHWRRWISTVLVCGCAYLIIATGSRSALIGGALGLAVVVSFSFIRKYGMRLFVILPLCLLFGGVGALFVVPDLPYIAQQTAEDLLKINDEHRGMSSGYTGRTEVWEEAFQLFKENWLLGVGFRAHELHMQSYWKSAHNGYLAMLAEVGVLGMVPLLLAITIKLLSSIREALGGSQLMAFGAGLWVALLFIAVFERYLVNIGNSTSLIGLVMLVSQEYSISRKNRRI